MGLKEAAQQALEALGSARSFFNGEHDTCGGCAWCDAPSYGPCEPHCDKDRAVKALRAALAEEVMQRLTDVQQELDCYGDGNVYRGQRSSDSQTPTLTIKDNLTVEPVAFIHSGCARRMREVLTQADFNGDKSEFLKYCMTDRNWLPLYPAPPKREPLTDEEIKRLYDLLPSKYTLAMFARAVERAHGIGGEE